MKQNRFKSKVVWLSIASALFLIYNTIAVELDLPTIAEDSYNVIINAVLGLLVTFGILNDPTSTDKF